MELVGARAKSGTVLEGHAKELKDNLLRIFEGTGGRIFGWNQKESRRDCKGTRKDTGIGNPVG